MSMTSTVVTVPVTTTAMQARSTITLVRRRPMMALRSPPTASGPADSDRRSERFMPLFFPTDAVGANSSKHSLAFCTQQIPQVFPGDAEKSAGASGRDVRMYGPLWVVDSSLPARPKAVPSRRFGRLWPP